MSPEKQRIAIAGSLGFQAPFEVVREWQEDGDSDGFVNVLRDARGLQVPGFPADLNAMHEAEKVLTRAQIPEWEFNMREITLRDSAEGSGLYERLIRATASQRAEAFLRTIGKWCTAQNNTKP